MRLQSMIIGSHRHDNWKCQACHPQGLLGKWTLLNGAATLPSSSEGSRSNGLPGPIAMRAQPSGKAAPADLPMPPPRPD